MYRRRFHKLLCKISVNLGPRTKRDVRRVIIIPEGNEKPFIGELPTTLRSAVGATPPQEDSNHGESPHVEIIALDDDTTLETRHGIEVRARDAKLYDFPNYAMASRSKVRQAGAPVNRTFNRVFGKELPIAPRASIELLSVGFVGEEMSVVDFPIRLFSRALHMHLEKIKSSIAEVTGQGGGAA